MQPLTVALLVKRAGDDHAGCRPGSEHSLNPSALFGHLPREGGGKKKKTKKTTKTNPNQTPELSTGTV